MKPIYAGSHSAYQDRVLNQDFLPTCSGLFLFPLKSKSLLYKIRFPFKGDHLHPIISGFSVGDTPGIDIFYDIHKCLWLSDNNNLSDSVHPPKEKPLKSKGKEEKAAPVEKVTVEDLFRQFGESPSSDIAPCARL